MPKVTGKDEEGETRTVYLDHYPDTCPSCKRTGTPDYLCISMTERPEPYSNIDTWMDIRAVFRCPNNDCRCVFTAFYRGNTRGSAIEASLKRTALPYYASPPKFTETISELSPRFCRAYQQAAMAEDNRLDLICGPGYRKALEYLVKDFLIGHTYKDNPDKQEQVRGQQLGPCIREHIDDKKTKETARRAAWLGNDETHYVQKWEGKDIDDLKRLINMTVNFIENEIDYHTYVQDMPEGAKGS